MYMHHMYTLFAHEHPHKGQKVCSYINNNQIRGIIELGKEREKGTFF